LRATALLLIFVVVGTLHYLLEKIWDVIWWPSTSRFLSSSRV
jgi:hypothetical protein